MYYYIDGYNLLFKLGYGDEELQKQRNALIIFLRQSIGLLKISATVVFDANLQEDLNRREHIDNLEIIYAAESESADDCIVKLLHERKRCSDIIVVTSDNLLSWRSRREGAFTISSQEFIDNIYSRYNKRRSLNSHKYISKKQTDRPKKNKDKNSVLNQEQYYASLSERPSFSDFDRYLKIFEARYRDKN